jgi:hypothetical protein
LQKQVKVINKQSGNYSVIASSKKACTHKANLKIRFVTATESKSSNRNTLCSSSPLKITMPFNLIKFDFKLCSTEILLLILLT